MAYRCIKWVKGKPYLYEQESYRVGGTVHTNSKYLGRASDADLKNCSKGPREAKPKAEGKPSQELRSVGLDTRAKILGVESRAQLNQTAKDTREAVARSMEPPQPPPPPSQPELPKRLPKQKKVITTNKPNKKPVSHPPNMRNKISLEQYGLGENPLKREMQNSEKMLARLGVDTGTLPQISLEYGSAVSHSTKRWGGGYRVTLARGEKGQRTQFKREFSKAVARRALDSIHKQAPETFARISSAMDTNYQATQQALADYISSTPGKTGVALYMRLTRNLPPIKKLPPEKIGLVEYGKRKSWEDDFCNIMGEVQRKGWKAFEKERQAEVFKAMAEEKKALDDYKKTPWIFINKRKKRDRIKRAQARIQANQRMAANIQFLKSELSGRKN